jgi:hypothetical protein
MSKIKEYYITEHEKRFTGVPPKDQNEPCLKCGKPYWMHREGGIKCPETELVEP